MQYDSTPFSWKIVFKYDGSLYEVALTAWSQEEEAGWRTHLDQTHKDDGRQTTFISSGLDMKARGQASEELGKCPVLNSRVLKNAP